MLTFITVFGLMVTVLGVIGAMRGWAKELINTFGVILALFLYDLMINETNVVQGFLDQIVQGDLTGGPRTVFLMISGLFLMIVFFAYLGPVAARAATGRGAVKPRETLQDALLGFMIGLFNGYLIVGSLWFFLEITGYPFPPTMMTRPVAGTASAEFVQYLPLVWLTPYLQYLLAVAFLLMIVMFV